MITFVNTALLLSAGGPAWPQGNPQALPPVVQRRPAPVFIANHGQFRGQVAFQTHAGGATVILD